MDRAAWGPNGAISALGGSHFGAEMGTGDRLDLEGDGGESESAWFPPCPPCGVSKENEKQQAYPPSTSAHSACPTSSQTAQRERERVLNGVLPRWLSLPVHSEAQPWTSINSQGFAYAFLTAGAGVTTKCYLYWCATSAVDKRPAPPDFQVSDGESGTSLLVPTLTIEALP
jgi:hypothetical protein